MDGDLQFLKPEQKYAVLVNNEVASTKGSLALSSAEAINLEVRWASGKILKAHLKAPADIDYDFRVVDKKIYWVDLDKAVYRVRANSFGGSTIPWTPRIISYEVTHFPVIFRLFPFQGIEFERILDSAHHLPEHRWRIAAKRPVGSYSGTNQFRVTNGKRSEVWKYEMTDYGSVTVDFEDAGSHWRVPVVHMKSTELVVA